MTTSHHPLARNKTALALAGAAILFAGVQFQPKMLFNQSRPNANPSGQTVAAVSRLPFSFDQIVNYFSDALQELPTQRSVNSARFDGGSGREGLFSVMIERRGPQLSVHFEVIDDYGMSVAREFFEAPFFRRDESERLYDLLGAGEGSRSAKMQRFDVAFDYETRPDETIINLLFSAQPQNPALPRM